MIHSRSPIVPLFYEWPEVAALHGIQFQILFCDSIMVVPVLDENATAVYVEKPPGNWYEYRTGKVFSGSENVPVSMEDLPLYLRGGRIVPVYEKSSRNTIETIVTDLTLIIGVDEGGRAEGTIYLDDGITFNYQSGEFIHRRFVYEGGILRWSKAEAEREKKIPEFLNKAKVSEIKIYEHGKVTRVAGLSYLVSGEWVWKKMEESGEKAGAGGGGQGSLLVIYGVSGLCVTIVGVVVSVVIWTRRRTFKEGLNRAPLVGQ
jgi:alpha-glucosidase (family GH31 glycosyl hydrolase)